MVLVFPSIELKNAAWEYRKEYIDFGETHIHGSSNLLQVPDYETWLKKILWNRTECTPEWVTGEVYFAMIDNMIVGTIAIRHYLNKILLNSGGHIGYGIRPTERHKGYGKQMLALALEKCREIGLKRVLVTCDKENIASTKTAMSMGAVFENEYLDENGDAVSRFWIDLS